MGLRHPSTQEELWFLLAPTRDSAEPAQTLKGFCPTQKPSPVPPIQAFSFLLLIVSDRSPQCY